MKSRRRFLVLALLFAGMPAHADDTLLLGVLEDSQCYRDLRCHYGRDKACVAAMERKVRLLFSRAPEGWTPLDSHAAAEQFDLNALAWTIAFDGRNLGSLRTIATEFSSRHAWTYSRDFVLGLRDGQSLPEIANENKGFGGWCEFPAHRPLVLVTRPYYQDPEQWKPFMPDESYRTRLMPEIVKALGIGNCFSDADAWVSHRIPAATDNSYRDNAGRELVSVNLDVAGLKCDFDYDPYLTTLVFLVTGGEVRRIGPDLQLIDAGDFDNDGKSEVLFWYSGYNRDGYTLFYDDFRQHVNYWWGYH